jgi:hypothetical protein
MTPKEKAKELLDKMAYGNSYDEYHNSSLYTAKQCALIAVDELLNNFLSNRTTEYGRERYHFWQQVKQEIEKL